jgi:hypothetical protein
MRIFQCESKSCALEVEAIQIVPMITTRSKWPCDVRIVLCHGCGRKQTISFVPGDDESPVR